MFNVKCNSLEVICYLNKYSDYVISMWKFFLVFSLLHLSPSHAEVSTRPFVNVILENK